MHLDTPLLLGFPENEVYLSIPCLLFIEQIFVEYILCARHSTKYLGYSGN